MSEQSNPTPEVVSLNHKDVVLRHTTTFKLLTVQELHLNRSRIVMPKMSLLERIRQQLMIRFGARDATLNRPGSYEIEIIPGSLKQRFSERPTAKKTSDSKLTHTSSNLG